MAWRMGLAALVGAGLLAGAAWAQHGGHHQHHGAAPPPRAERASIRITMEELHRSGGVPPGWKFTWPAGDAKAGREVFARLECYQCHDMKGESFPPVARDPQKTGPALSGMGDHHPAEYFAESILDPNAVIVLGPGHTGPDGRSIMPDYRDSLTVTELTDLVAYVKSLTGGGHGAHGDHAGAAREQTAGDYRIRIAYEAGAGHATTGHGTTGQPGGHHPHGAAGGAAAHDHLMVFVTDVKTGESVPYLPITATVHAASAAPRAVKLMPMMGGRGFHYGANLTLPPKTTRITLAIGRTTMHVMPSAAGRFAQPLTVRFDWAR